MSQLSRLILYCLFILVSLTPLALCQSVNEADAKLQDLLLEVRKNPDDALTKLKAIPALQEAFSNAPDALTKLNTASALVELGQKDDVYWSVLSKRAQEIVDSTAPDPVLYDANGKGIRGAISPEFLEWVKANNLSQNDALYDHLGTLPADLSLMAITGDPRGLPILRKGLLSPNYAIRHSAARGLAGTPPP
jgi:HEAT repeat protein